MDSKINGKARDFLNDIHEMCERYDVSMITVMNDSVTIISNGNRLSFKTYVDGQYSTVKIEHNCGDYFPEEWDES